MTIKLKKLLPTVILCMAATFAAHAEKSRVVDIDFSSPEDYSFYLGNHDGTDFAEKSKENIELVKACYFSVSIVVKSDGVSSSKEIRFFI